MYLVLREAKNSVGMLCIGACTVFISFRDLHSVQENFLLLSPLSLTSGVCVWTTLDPDGARQRGHACPTCAGGPARPRGGSSMALVTFSAGES